MSLETPFAMVGGRERVLALAERFYDVMERDEPELTATHELDENGKVCRRSRDRFGLFLSRLLRGAAAAEGQRVHVGHGREGRWWRRSRRIARRAPGHGCLCARSASGGECDVLGGAEPSKRRLNE